MNDQMATSKTPEIILKAKRRMSYFLLLLLILFLIKAVISFPFVDHTSISQNFIYSLVVTLPFVIINIIFIILTGKDLAQTKTQKPPLPEDSEAHFVQGGNDLDG